MTVAPAGMVTFAPTAVITPLEKTIVPFGIGAEVTGTIVALRIATVGFLPLLLRITDCAQTLPQKNASANANRLLTIARLRLRAAALVLRFFVGLFLQPLRFFLRHVLAHLQVALTVEVDLSFDERRLHARVGGERMAGPDHEVGVFAGVDRSDALFEAELRRGIQRAELQRLLFRKSAVLHCFGRIE